jgi:hypothetical protein
MKYQYQGLLAPAYIFLGLGAEYATKNKDKLLIYLLLLPK